jgi:hypothetical protein
MAVSAFAYIVYFAYLTSFLAILAGAIYFARGDAVKGKKYVGSAIGLALLVTMLPYAFDYIVSGTSVSAPSEAGDRAFVNLVYPYPNAMTRDANSHLHLIYTDQFSAVPTVVGIRIDFQRPNDSESLTLNIDGTKIVYGKDDPIVVTIHYPDHVNNGVSNIQMKDAELKLEHMVSYVPLGELSFNNKDDYTSSFSYVIEAKGTK